jgi:hypothetical protein
MAKTPPKSWLLIGRCEWRRCGVPFIKERQEQDKGWMERQRRISELQLSNGMYQCPHCGLWCRESNTLWRWEEEKDDD